MSVGKFRKIPVEIEAIQYVAPDPGSGVQGNATEIADWGAPIGPTAHWGARNEGGRNYDLVVGTLEDGEDGGHQVEYLASPGDFIIRGVKGEFYPCKADIFAETYEEV